MKLLIPLAFVLFMTGQAEAHCYRDWRYPEPQRGCGAARVTHRHALRIAARAPRAVVEPVRATPAPKPAPEPPKPAPEPPKVIPAPPPSLDRMNADEAVKRAIAIDALKLILVTKGKTND